MITIQLDISREDLDWLSENIEFNGALMGDKDAYELLDKLIAALKSASAGSSESGK